MFATINGGKSGIMRMRRKAVKRTIGRFHVGGKKIGVVKYKYLWSLVSVYLTNVRIVEERGRAGAKALRLRRCRVVREVKGATFVRLLEFLLESVLLYGVEVWGDGTQLEPVENVQMRAARRFLGVGRRHPSASLQYEMGMLTLEWGAVKRFFDFWVQVMVMKDDTLVKVVILEALKLGSKVQRVKDLH